MRNKMLACLRYNLKKLLSSPVTYLVIVLTVLFVDREILPVRNYLRDSGELVSWPGLLTYLLDYAPLTLLLGLAMIALLSHLPMTDEAQVYIMARSGRKSWARAQVALIFVVAVAYMVLVALTVLLWISPYVDWSGGWSDGILAFVEGGAYETYDSLLSYDPWVMRTYAPWAAALMELALHALAYGFVALLVYVGNVLFGRRGGVLLGVLPLAADALMASFYAGLPNYFSPVTLSRATMLDYGDGAGYPPVWYAFVALMALCALFAYLSVRLSMKKELRI
ncbi:MAG TPA: hypothetical protein IAA52_03810 [Candidatus Pullichristensenella stercorigallinarum]|uniref:Uncharacterized protein n=1 Tax=Candidatus Pullichristensenella stercorigallinarum TaxID=2840909 RepID=A0A9D1CVP2_9FIRM|nr:hypothetical protein [Candidatus Pullichristensenella stercorigallinarum]